ncbi:hypothetical protein M409DRAFT_61651 [Zasmidium cellare ATCC 36951]|uniref:CSC1/OSCA1-like 7TM region domain-containing protein n=1 Tax=Zasmidium cellare ATCC 36951 TaxID=1080233 RepID=A0A6A6BWN1_ZASCE|nr:uncharacterized protein M409DRAFT_61651 [Zasmidium cellare ATCC 36951]KAF2158448.1 hypothetical protein M409DRAFT_61651 [Zasmidium cellare ATCC 36951]
MTKLPAPSTPCQWSLVGLLDCTSGLAVKAQARSVGALVAVLAAATSSFLVQVILFALMRSGLPRIYEPLAYQTPTTDAFTVLRDVFALTDRNICTKRGRDAYFFLRYLELLLKIFIPAAVLGLAILLPVNLLGGNGDTGLASLTTSNVHVRHSTWLWTHVAVAAAFTSWTCFLVHYEMQHYIHVRHTWNKTAGVASRTVFVQDIPPDYLDSDKLWRLFATLPGGVKKVWINRDFATLRKKVKSRDCTVDDLEAAETRLIQMCSRLNHERDASLTLSIKGLWSSLVQNPALNPNRLESLGSLRGRPSSSAKDRHACDSNCSIDDDDHPAWKAYISTSHRETTRLRSLKSDWTSGLSLFGAAVDKICQLRCKLARLNENIALDQTRPEAFPLANSAFVQFHSELAASLCCQAIAHDKPRCMMPRGVGIEPDTIIWDHLGLTWWQRAVRVIFVFCLLSTLIALYSVPIALTSFLAKISLLAEVAPWLSWVRRTPAPVVSIVQGILPPTFLNIMLATVPMLIRRLVQSEGPPDTAVAERHVQHWFFLFLLVQVFFVVTLSGSLAETAVGLAGDAAQTLQHILSSIPKASTFFLSYMAVEGLSTSASTLLQVDSLARWFIYAPLLDHTARQKRSRQTTLKTLELGTVLPLLSNFVVIASVYSILAPLMLAFAVVVFITFMLAYRYNILYVYRVTDTGAHFLPTAIQHIFPGLYIMQLCLTGHFFAVSDGGRLICIPQALVVLISFFGTILFHCTLRCGTWPLLEFKAMTLRQASIDSVQADQSGTLNSTMPNALDNDFEDWVLRVPTPTIWLPRDALGVSDNEVQRTKQLFNIDVDNQHAALDETGRVIIWSHPFNYP